MTLNIFPKTAKLYMKSGNVIIMKGIKDISIKAAGNEVISLSVEFHWSRRFFEKVLISTINLSQIEAVSFK